MCPSRFVHALFQLLFAIAIPLSFGTSAEAHQLRGRIQFLEPILGSRTPVIDKLLEPDWNSWLKRIGDEVVAKTLSAARRDHLALAGNIETKCTVHRDGSITIEILTDNSTNLGLLIPNVLESLNHAPVLAFPSHTSRECVTWTTRYQAVSEDDLSIPLTSQISEQSIYLRGLNQ